MANSIVGKIGIIYPTQTIPAKNGGNPFVKRKFVIRALRFNPDDGTPELSERNTPILEIQGQDRVGILDNFKQGDVVKVNIIVEGRSKKNQDGTYEFFNSVLATRIEKQNIVLDEPQQAAPQQAPVAPQANQGQQQVAQAPAQGGDGQQQANGSDDLPF